MKNILFYILAIICFTQNALCGNIDGVVCFGPHCKITPKDYYYDAEGNFKEDIIGDIKTCMQKSVSDIAFALEYEKQDDDAKFLGRAIMLREDGSLQHHKGKVICKYKNGQIALEGEHIDGGLIGDYYKFYPSGKLKEKHTNKEHIKKSRSNLHIVEEKIMTDYTESYYESGEINEKKYHQGSKIIAQETYYKSGQLNEKTDYFIDRWHSNTLPLDSFTYYENGQLKEEKHYEILTASYFPLTSISAYYENGKPHIKTTGNKRFEICTEVGTYGKELCKPYEIFYENGNLKEKLFSDNSYEEYWENGNIKEKCEPPEGTRLSGQQDCKSWDINGQLNENAYTRMWIT